MFSKPFKIKFNNQLKVTDKKRLKKDFEKAFPKITGDDLEKIIPKKDLVTMLKLETSSGLNILVYAVNKQPIVFVHEGVFYPTVYLLWEYPNLLLTFTTHSGVLPKLMDGANLMLPGVVYPNTDIPNFLKNTPVCINLTTNKAAFAIGVTALSSNDMKGQNKGKCVVIYHIHGDKLCTLQNIPCLALPSLGFSGDEPHSDSSTVEASSMVVDTKPNEEVAATSSHDAELSETACCLELSKTAGALSLEDKANDLRHMEEMNRLIFHCFLAAIKYSKNMPLPILISTFYKVYMVPACSEGQIIDIKKSSYKKLSTFLQDMCDMGLIKIEEQKKGVATISGINYEHSLVAEYYLHPVDRPYLLNKDVAEDLQPSISSAHCVTAIVLPIFSEFGISRGTAIIDTDIRKYVTEYVKRNRLQNEDNKNLVNINASIGAICRGVQSVTWQSLMENIYNSMTACYRVSCGETEMVHKGKLESINITVAKRSGNKKVTLVDNLETYGINIEEFSSNCQRGVAASTTINRGKTAKKTDQVQVQGNQVLFVYNLLIDKYNVPKKYIRGLEFAPKVKHSK